MAIIDTTMYQIEHVFPPMLIDGPRREPPRPSDGLGSHPPPQSRGLPPPCPSGEPPTPPLRRWSTRDRVWSLPPRDLPLHNAQQPNGGAGPPDCRRPAPPRTPHLMGRAPRAK